ncbi:MULTISPECIES: heavy metal translocating P-type ATPase [Thermoanaerobacterium]|uniref:Cd(2+)-exporting ATPase n=2 Tax=Thermoanaerobacterium TaxID=28895 RepID=W9EC63_9THEO|nr:MULTISPECIES: heavy metal translocating P-type ATPase [Thermoanaerobacterium]AFK86302.1 heavy metal translocating P-type ATPase [Thermoanaerobacterium saccharolyticum JW/SL-YS485]ETO37354.1 heavy metal translocating P-type ATPase [Thermoanaerobacterium aotearoense SCUT27]
MIREIFSLPGLARLSFDVLYKDKSIEKKINHYLKRSKGIKYISASSVTGKVLVKYEGKTIEEIKREIINAIFKDNVDDNVKPYEPEDLPLKTQFVMVFMPLAATIYTALKRIFAGKSPLSGHYGLLSMSSIVSIVAGYPIFRSGINTLFKEHKINGDLMITVATTIMLFIRESILGLVVIFLVNLSVLIHSLNIHYNKKALESFLKLKPGKVWMALEGREIEVPVEELNEGDVISLKKGDVAPYECEVVEGSAIVDEKYIRGKVKYVKKQKGDKIVESSLIVDGEVKGRITDIEANESIEDLYKIVELESKEKYITNTADVYINKIIPLSFIITGLVALYTNDILKGISSMLVLCPCTFAHGSTGVYGIAVKNAAKRGILIKSSSAIENMAKADVLIFDKTGTLTEGRPIVSEILPSSNTDKNHILKIAASAESGVIHPVALSIIKKADDMGIKVEDFSHGKEVKSMGAFAYVDGKQLHVGNERFMEINNIDLHDVEDLSNVLKNLNRGVIYVAVDGNAIGVIGMKDVLKKKSKAAVEFTRSLGFNDDGIYILSGDDKEPTDRVAYELGIVNAFSSVSPDEKKNFVKRQKDDGRTVVMVGDGLNDVKAMRSADVGIILGRPISKKILKALDVAVIDENPLKIPYLIELSRYSKEVINQNHVIASMMSYVEYIMTLFGKVNPFMAAMLHSINQMIVLANSLKVYKYSSRRIISDGRNEKEIRRSFESFTTDG